MKVDFYTLKGKEGSDLEYRVVGRVSIVDGVLSVDSGEDWLVSLMAEPIYTSSTGLIDSEVDPERFLKTLPSVYRSPYLRAELATSEETA